MLRFEKIKKEYGNFLALDIPALTIENGLTWLQGENGSGKTTFLKMIAGLHPFKGDIILCNTVSIRKQRRQFVNGVNYAEAEPLYPSFLTAEELVKLFCYAKNGDINETKSLLEQLHIYDAYKNKLGTYSSGMIKKLSLALAFIGKPKLVLLDEPLITIDTASIYVVSSAIKSKFEKENTSFIITSHHQIPAELLSINITLLAANHTIIKNAE